MRSRFNIVARLILIGTFAFTSCALVSDTARAGDGATSQIELERPDDPPGTPARPTPGALRSAPVTFGSFTSIQVNVDGAGANIAGDAANEPSIAVDPNAPNHMAIGWRQFDTIASNFRQAGNAYTTDGGRTWTFPGVLDPGVFRSDPVLSFDAAGVFYYNSLKVINPNTPEHILNCAVFKSFDGGMTWDPEVFAFGGDKAWTTVDRTGGMGDGHLYQAWNLAANQYGDSLFSRSTDENTSWERPQLISQNPVWGTLDVASDGTLYISGISDFVRSDFMVAKSTNAKNAAATPTFTSTIFSLGGSQNFGTGPNPGGMLGQVWLTVDRSGGANDGNVYVLCTIDPTGPDPGDVIFSRSTDGGANWSAPVRINDDAAGSRRWQWFGTMSIAPNGRLDVIWNDNRNHTPSINMSELFYSFSTDGGLTWSPNQQLSPVWDSFLGWPNQNKIGDYYHMVSDDVGASLAWAATFNGEQDVYYLRIGDYDCNTNGVADSLDIAGGGSDDDNMNGIPDECEDIITAVGPPDAAPFRLHQNVTNPFNPITTIAFDMPAAGGYVQLLVFDASGRLVRMLVDGYLGAGRQHATWDGRDASGNAASSGIYFYRLEAAGFSESRKMVLLK